MAKALDTRPSPLALCIMLARNDHMAGALLTRIAHWSPYGRAEIPLTSGYWIANKRGWWMREARLSPDQYDRSIRKLKHWKLVEAQQFWWGGRNILHVRATELTIGYLAAAKTWKAADELIAGVKATSEQQQFSKTADQGSAKALISNGVSKSEKPGSAIMLNPNNIINVHLNPSKKNDTSAPASPTCADQAGSINKSGQEEITLKSLFEVWETTAEKFHADEIAAGKFSGKLTAKEKGCIAEFYAVLASCTDSAWQPVDFAPDIIAFCVSSWGCFSSKHYPYPHASFLTYEPSRVLNSWIKAGKPKCETTYLTMFGCEYKKL